MRADFLACSDVSSSFSALDAHFSSCLCSLKPSLVIVHLLVLDLTLPMICCGGGGGGSLVAKSRLTFVTPWAVARQAPLSVGFPRQKYGGELPFPSSGDLPDPGIEPLSPTLQAISCIDVFYPILISFLGRT